MAPAPAGDRPLAAAKAASGPAAFVGREPELAELDAALADARNGRGRLFLIAGEPGIGKTRLAEAVVERGIEHGMVAAWGRAWESAGAPAYWPWTQVLRSLAAKRDASALAAEFGADVSRLAQVLPEFAGPPATAPDAKSAPPGAATSEKARFALFDAVGSFLHDVAASKPLVIVLDDLHAADPASLLLLEFVAHGVPDAPILMLATFQEAAARGRPEVEWLLGVLGRHSPTITLRGFGEQNLARVVELRTGKRWPPRLLDALRETTEGNPFFAIEVLRLVPGEQVEALAAGRTGVVSLPLPETVREAVRRRFAALDPDALEALEAAAVIGREFRVATLRKVVGEDMSQERLIEVLDGAAEAGLVSETAAIGRYRFTHNLIRETLYSSLAAGRRVKLHRAVGTAIEETYGEAPEHLVELAHHFAQASPAGGADKALGYALKAANEAMRLFAYEQAADLFELALEMDELDGPEPRRKAELMLALGRARARADYRGARETLIEAGEAGRAAGDSRLLAEAALSMRAWPLGSGILDEQPARLLREALELTGPRDEALRARLLARLGAALYYWSGTEAERTELVDEAVAIARRLDDPATLAHVLSNGQLATWGPDHTVRDLAWMEELLELIPRMGGADELELAARNRQIDFLVELGDLPAADAALRALELTVGESSDPRTEGYVCLQRARHAIIEGRYAEAERLNAQAVEIGSRLRDPNMVILAANQVAGIRWTQGRLGDEIGQITGMIERDVTPAWQSALAVVSCERGHDAEARRVIDRMAANDFADLPRYNGWLVTLALLSEACVHVGDRERAATLHELMLPFAERNVTSPQALFAGPVARFLGILAAARGEWEAAAEHFDAARAAAARMNAPPVTARVNLDEAEMLVRRDAGGDRDAALALIDETRALAARPGMEWMAESVDALAAQAGAGAVPAAAAAPSGADFARLRREGELWAFEFGGRSVRLRDSKGARYIACLLARPGVEMHAAQLAAGDGAAALASAGGVEPGELGGPEAADAGPLLDPQAKSAYRLRIEELREDIEEAESFNDPERAARAREELDFIERELAGAVGLGGRDRKAASSAERARVSVTKAIRATVKRIREHDPILARELEATIRTGTFCVHEPDPRHPLEWRVEGA